MRARPSLLTSIVLLAACGSRSDLDDAASAGRETTATATTTTTAGPGGSGGSAGAAVGGSEGGGGAGGGGGTPVEGWPCTIAVDGPNGIAAVPGFEQSWPRLSYSSDDGAQVTLAMRLAQPGGMSPTELHHVSFSPWGDWPAGDLQPVYLADPDRGNTFDITPAPNSHFALLMNDWHPGTGIWFAPAMTPSSDAISAPTQVDDGSLVLFASGRGNQYLVGLWDSAGPKRYRVLTVDGAAVSVGASHPLTCTALYSGLEVADATPTLGGWLMAASGVGTFGASDCQDGGQQDTAIHLATVDAAGNATPISTTIPGVNIHFLVLTTLPQQDPWLAWSQANQPISDGVARLDSVGKMLSQVAVPNPGHNRFAAAPMLDGLLLVRGYANSVNLTFVHPDGGVSPTMPIPALDGTGVLEALPSPDGASVLLALQSSPVAPEARLWLARVRCQ